MPGQEDEAAAIFEWLAREVSPDTYVNIMGQYRPDYQVGQIAANGREKPPAIGLRPTPGELEGALRAARRAGLWRFDQRAGVAAAE
jgi:putative pyruvate formate lyase activating enzyme